MKLQVTIDGQVFEVEIQDLHTRPIVAVVDGEPVEVWPQEVVSQAAPTLSSPVKPKAELSLRTKVTASSGNNQNIVYAPIPGVLVSIAVQPGAEVIQGQELCIIEAMKMKNAIRATRAGRISAVLVSAGQQVKHRDILMEYSE